MPRIKVTGYMNTEDLPGEDVDLLDKTGLSADALQTFGNELGLDDVKFELEG